VATDSIGPLTAIILVPDRQLHIAQVLPIFLFMLYTCGVMTVYEVPPNSPYQRQFRSIGRGAIVVLLGILIFSVYEPAGLSDSVGHAIGWIAGAFVLATCAGAAVLAIEEGKIKSLRRLRFEIFDGKIVQTGEESTRIQIPLDQIDSLYEYRGRLLVRGGDPRRQIAIPREVKDFDVLKSELLAHGALTPHKAKFHPWSILPLVLLLVAYFFLFTSHVRTVVISAGVAALALQGAGTYSLWRVWRGKTLPRLVVPTYVMTWLVLAWLVYQRFRTAG
jgi:hypothetical protein